MECLSDPNRLVILSYLNVLGVLSNLSILLKDRNKYGMALRANNNPGPGKEEGGKNTHQNQPFFVNPK